MNYEYQKIQKTLKVLMKSKRATYQSVAMALKVSPATIKRRLNGDDLTLQQLKEFAEALSVSFYELIELSKNLKREAHTFSLEQEKLLASDIRVMLLFRFILAGQNFSSLKNNLNMTEKELQRLGLALEKVGLAQLLPGNRFLSLVHFPFRWQPEGPLTKAYNEVNLINVTGRIRNDKGTAGFNKQFEFALSPEAYTYFCSEVATLYSKYQSLSEIHLSLPIDLNHVVSGLFFIDRFSIWDRDPIRSLKN